MSATVPDDLPADVVEQAIGWSVRLESGQAGVADYAGCDAWRAAHPDHERLATLAGGRGRI